MMRFTKAPLLHNKTAVAVAFVSLVFARPYGACFASCKSPHRVLRAAFVRIPFLAFSRPASLASDTPWINKKGPNIRRIRAPSFMSATDQLEIRDMVSSLANPSGVNLETVTDGLQLYRKIMACEVPQLTDSLRGAMQVLRDALRLYGPDHMIGSFNGGKDAVAIMHLLRASLANYSVEQGQAYRLKVIYFENDREFPEVTKLVSDNEKKYDLDLWRSKLSFVEGLAERIREDGQQQEQQPQANGLPSPSPSFAFVLGTRRGDPNCGLQSQFTPSSDWMPPFMRVNPILEWNYGQVWAFLRDFDLPYCSLYDRGYTSLGTMDNTFPNPALKVPAESDDSGSGKATEGGYYPAYMLSDWSLERAGRGKQALDILACELKDIDKKQRKVREARTAGLVVIGDEILKGKCQDINTAFATKQLWNKGIIVKRVAVVPDDEDAIAHEVRGQVDEFDVVITSGGVGPTHDDITIYAVAGALNQCVRPNEDMLQKLMHAFKLDRVDQLTSAQQKMAMLPELAKLRVAPLDDKGWPILQCENIFILPGVPQFFQSKMQVIAEHFLDERPMHRKKIVLSADEFLIVEPLNEAVAAHPSVQFGSYPYYSNPSFKTVVTLEAEAEADVVAAVEALLASLPAAYVVKVVDDDDLKDV